MTEVFDCHWAAGHEVRATLVKTECPEVSRLQIMKFEQGVMQTMTLAV